MKVVSVTMFTVLACMLAAQERHVVSESSTTFDLVGKVTVDRNNIFGIRPQAEDLIVTALYLDGYPVQLGEEVVLFSNQLVIGEILERTNEIRTAEERYTKSMLKLQDDLATLTDRLKGLESQLTSKEAALEVARNADPEQIALAQAELAEAERQFELAQRDYDQDQRRHQLGQISSVALTESRQRLEREALSLERQRETTRRTIEERDEERITQLELERAELLARIGTDDAETPTGLKAEIAAVTSKQQRDRSKLEAELERARQELHEGIRDSYDHTPLRSIVITPEGSDEAVFKVRFGPADSAVCDGWHIDSGLPYDPNRGYGWSEDLSDCVRDAAPVDEKVAASDAKDQRRDKRHRRGNGRESRQGMDIGARRTGNGEEVDASREKRFGCLAINRGATWRVALPAGTYSMSLTFGDRVEWHGCHVLVNNQHIYHPSLEADAYRRNTVNVVVADDGQLQVDANGPYTKTLRAEKDGVVIRSDWFQSPGDRIRRTVWPIIYLADRSEFLLRCRVHQDLLPLLRTTTTQVEPITTEERETLPPPDLIRRCREVAATDTLEVSVAGRTYVGEIVNIADTAVPLSWQQDQEGTSQQDLIAREIDVRLPPDALQQLNLEERLHCRAKVTLPDGCYIVPVHFVSNDSTGTLIRKQDSQAQAVTAFRISDMYAICTGITSGDVLLVPDSQPESRDHTRAFSGEVVAANTTTVSLPKHWGRIKTMIPEGSQVTAGELLIELYNPYIEANAERTRQAHKQARQDFLIAAEQRQVDLVKALIEHRQKIIAEKLARNELAQVRKIDAERIRRSVSDRKLAADKRDHLANIATIARTNALMDRLEDDEQRLAQAELQLTRARLTEVAALRQVDWIKWQQAEDAWRDKLTELSWRESDMQILRTQQQVAATAAELRLAQALEGNWWEQLFNDIRLLYAPIDGRLFYRTAWDDQTNSQQRMTIDTIVWGGMPIADIVDMSELAFTAELPEFLYSEINPGLQVELDFGQYSSRRLAGSVTEKGRSAYIPDRSEGTDSTSITSRVFKVTIQFAVPGELRGRLTPGMRGRVWLP